MLGCPCGVRSLRLGLGVRRIRGESIRGYLVARGENHADILLTPCALARATNAVQMAWMSILP
jgi:hypothetical protein